MHSNIRFKQIATSTPSKGPVNIIAAERMHAIDHSENSKHQPAGALETVQETYNSADDQQKKTTSTKTAVAVS